MDVEQLKDDVREGRIELERLVELIGRLQQQLDAAKEELKAAQRRIEELEKVSPEAASSKTDQPYSMKAEEKRQQQRGKPKRKRKRKNGPRRGRISTAEKLKLCQRTEPVFPEDCSPQECWLSHARPVWRLEDGRAVLVAYEIYRARGNRYGKIPGVLGRSEFGLEIVLAIAYQVYLVGLSLDKVCQLMNFFQNLKLRKSQVDALLNQLARQWEEEFDHLCTLLAHSLVVHADETSWSLHSVWAFLSEKARILLFGVHKDAATLKQLLNPATFGGLLISDDAAVYGNFSHAQKCWAHLIRKAIKLTLQDPDNAEYRRLADGLLEVYRQACRVQSDRRLGDAGRQRKVAVLEDQVLELCVGVWAAELPKLEGAADGYRLLCNELMRLLLAEELFCFVTAAAVRQPNGTVQPVSGTNNEAERTLRGSAQARVTGRTNKTPAGARRQTVITSVLESLRNYLKTLTLASVIEEITSWWQRGDSCFARASRRIAKSKHQRGVLDSLLPQPDG
jgi:hypothetical protein